MMNVNFRFNMTLIFDILKNLIIRKLLFLVIKLKLIVEEESDLFITKLKVLLIEVKKKRKRKFVGDSQM